MGGIYGHNVFDLAEGDYRIEVDNPEFTDPYSFTSHVVVPAGGSVGAGFQSRWDQLGGSTGSLGNPTADQVCAGNGDCYQVFANGVLIAVNGSTYLTSEAMVASYESSGGSTGPWGAPTNDMVWGLRDSGFGQRFEHGSVYGSASSAARVVLEPVRSSWAEAGWENGTLGYPTSDQVCDANQDCYQSFQGGEVITTPGHRAVTTTEIRRAWLASGGDTGPTGAPTNNVICGSANGGCYQDFTNTWWFVSPTTPAAWISRAVMNSWPNHEWGSMGYPTANPVCDANSDCYQTFQNGEMLIVNNAASTTTTAIREAWLATGGHTGPTGAPTNNVICGSANGGCYQDFTNTWWFVSPTTPAAWISRAVMNSWPNHESGPMGYPTSNPVCQANGDCRQSFQNGAMLIVNNTAYQLSAAILTAYQTAGGSTGTLGAPVDSRGMVCGLADTGCHMEFQHGSIYTSAHTPATVVTDPIRARWGQTGGETGTLGYPTGPVVCDQTTSNCVQPFQNGQMLLITGIVYPLSTAILTAYQAAGGSTGVLGTPTDPNGMVCGLPDTGCSMALQHGTIYTSAHTPAVIVTDPIATGWSQHGGAAGQLGYPTANATIDTKGTTTTDDDTYTQTFQQGSITWNQATGYTIS